MTTPPGTLTELFASAVSRYPDNEAVVDGGQRLSYRELDSVVSDLCAQLQALGVARGFFVALLLPNSLHFVAGFHATARLGAIVTPLNIHYQKQELSYFLDENRPRVLITRAEFTDLCREVLSDLTNPPELLVLDEETAASSSSSSGSTPDAADAIVCQYSSGSTGKPKRIVRTQGMLAVELHSLHRTLAITERDRLLGVAPFSHVNGLVRSMLASTTVGATLVTLRQFKRQEVATTIQRERITVFIAVPFMFSILAETRFRTLPDFSSLRRCVSSSAPMPASLNRKFREKYGRYVRQLYGSTETGSISVNESDEIAETLESVGHPLHGVEISVYRDDGTEAGVDEVGEIAVKSPSMITGYGNLPAESQPFRDGFFLTGDVGKRDAAGHLYLLGRKTFFINKGGYKINPDEIETLIGQLPQVKEVVVIGVPTPFGDEQVKAVVVPEGVCTQEDIVAFCRGKIADFKLPSTVEFRESMPKSATGKILRKEL